MVPLQGAIVVCCGWGRRGDQLWGRGAIAGCHCSVLWCGEGRVSTNFGMDVVPLQGAIVVGCRCDDRAIAGCPWQPT